MTKPKYSLIKNNCDDANPNANENVNGDKYLFGNHQPQMQFIICFLLILCLYLIYIQQPLDVSYEINVTTKKTTQRLSTSTTKFTSRNSTWSHSVKPIIAQTSEIYFIYTSQCRVPYVEPFGDGVTKLFNPKKFQYTNCTKDEALITSNYQLNTSEYILHMNIPAIERAAKVVNASAADVGCCYSQIVRAGSGGAADEKYNLLSCSVFHQDFKVPQHIDYIITECYINNKKREIIQKDAFSFVQQQNINATNSSEVPTTPADLQTKKPSILLLGIDSLSRINLRRTMPATFKFLQNNNWFELQGYNKVGDNTFPNLMALLTSYNKATALDKCKPTTVGGLNKPICNLIWNNFKQYGYKTAYAEDTCSLSTFNYIQKGFLEPPTDYYLRPMLIAISKNLKVTKKAGLDFCIGRKHYGDYIFDNALQFANAFPKDPLFGLFWTNSFSHNSFDTTATMDVKVLEYLMKMKSDGILDRTIVMFFADHGVRWGPLLNLKSAFLEERLPMMFMSLPPRYRNENPDVINALQINQKRLTSPYDIYATLKQILEDSDPDKKMPYLNDTIQGLSIFREIPENRTCTEAGIPEHWCTCTPYEILPTKDAAAKNVTVLVINEINRYLEARHISNKCSILALTSIKRVEKKMYDTANQSTYRITFIAKPKAPEFQATAIYDNISGTITTNVEEISRLNSYAHTSGCVDIKEAKKFCIC